ncbi:hypothetical protein POVCU2_0071960 [Plasmodium ovale curtisi]|uniref:Uncharacterized protein n=1 Tax=Plasmodium ovale curtisi TaxID=864141 RepID=A0A1A8XFZ6_PLAOA|nr:hypothetical protein POVCU2_0071960 [Plasmodium ovale curtisi]SBT02849.1 hypothetical protein POVCU1_081440 [Plasmodium ovale curtisi]
MLLLGLTFKCSHSEGAATEDRLVKNKAEVGTKINSLSTNVNPATNPKQICNRGYKYDKQKISFERQRGLMCRNINVMCQNYVKPFSNFLKRKLHFSQFYTVTGKCKMAATVFFCILQKC